MKILISESQYNKILKEMSVSAYHGTPHEFEKFTSNKVGAGESTQWFGWGLYFTDQEDIADWYAKSVNQSVNQERELDKKVYFRNRVISKVGINKYTRENEIENYKGNEFKEIFQIMGIDIDFLNEKHKNELLLLFLRDYINRIYSFLKKKYNLNNKSSNEIVNWENVRYSEKLWNEWLNWIYGGDKKPLIYATQRYYEYDKPIDTFGTFIPTEEDINNYINDTKDFLKKTLSSLQENDFEIKSNPKLEKSITYHVTLHKGKTPENYDYLSWYDTLNDNQKQKIINQIKKEKLKKNNFYIVKPKDDETEVQPRFFKNFADAKNVANNWNRKNMVMGVVMNEVGVEKGTFNVEDLNKTVKELYTQLCGLLGSPKEASMFLLKSGIDGIKYPTNTISGGDSKGFNYVVFDENAITIEKKIEK